MVSLFAGSTESPHFRHLAGHVSCRCLGGSAAFGGSGLEGSAEVDKFMKHWSWSKAVLKDVKDQGFTESI